MNESLRCTNIPDFKLYYRAIVIKAACHWQETDTQASRIEDPDVNPQNYSHMIFDKRCHKYTLKEKTISSINGAGKKWISIFRKVKN